MRFHTLTVLLIQFILIFSTPVFAQVPVNPSSVDVNNLSDAQIQRIMQEMQTRGLTQDQAIALAKAQGASQTQIAQRKIGRSGSGTTLAACGTTLDTDAEKRRRASRRTLGARGI